MGELYTELDGSASLAYAEVLDNSLSKNIVTGEGFSLVSRWWSTGLFVCVLDHGQYAGGLMAQRHNSYARCRSCR